MVPIQMNLVDINSIWIGPKLGPVHAACLKSFVRHGHKVTLHVYRAPLDVPEGVEISDANQLIAEAMMFRNRRTGSLAPFADLLRYEMLKHCGGLYMDCDMFLLKPIADAEYIFGWADSNANLIPNGVLKLPPDCPVLAELANLKNTPDLVPEWFSRIRRIKYRVKRTAGLNSHSDLSYMALGPPAVTHFLRKHGLLHHALPSDVFFNPSRQQIQQLCEPNFPYSDIIPPSATAIHLANSALNLVSAGPFPKSSLVGQIAEGGTPSVRS